MKKHVVVLGAGFGGLELSTLLSGSNADDVHVTLIDRSDSFIFGFSKLEVMLGRRSVDDVRSYYRDITKDGLEFRRETVTSIDPANRHVTTDAGSYEADFLAVALGADYDHEATPGFVDGGHDYYDVGRAARMSEILPSFDGGNVVIAVLGVPFKCPPAPFEGAFLLHDYFVERGVRDRTQIKLITPMDAPIPPSPETSKAIVDGATERGIALAFGEKVTGVDASNGVAELRGGGAVPYDLFVGIPVHKAPPVVQASGLTEGGNDGWVKVDQRTLRTPFDGVYALGDCADAPVPRAGVFAENAARIVADDITAKLAGRDTELAYEGKGTCYIEFGQGLVGRVDVDFLSGPKPSMPFRAPSAELASEKEEFAATRRRRWFGTA